LHILESHAILCLKGKEQANSHIRPGPKLRLPARGKTGRGAPPAQTSPALAVPIGATPEWRRNRLKRFDPDSQMARAIRSGAVTPALPST
jgi:hypothetical protein